jgi:hypothetical protein
MSVLPYRVARIDSSIGASVVSSMRHASLAKARIDSICARSAGGASTRPATTKTIGRPATDAFSRARSAAATGRAAP